MKLRVGDTVEVIAGKDRGKKGKVERVIPTELAVVVERVNRAKKHLKPTRRYPQGGIVEVSRSIPVGNVMVVCPHCGKRTRVAMKVVDGKKIRICRHCSKALDEKGEK